jgi:hypothetical protein
MLYDSGGNRGQTVAALRELIPRLQAHGYRFTVSQGLGLSGPPAASLGQRIRGQALHWTGHRVQPRSADVRRGPLHADRSRAIGAFRRAAIVDVGGN